MAISIDECLLMCRRLHENNLRALRRMVATCLRELDLDLWLRRRLEKIEYVLVRKPEKAYNAFSALRRSMIVTVPGLL